MKNAGQLVKKFKASGYEALTIEEIAKILTEHGWVVWKDSDSFQYVVQQLPDYDNEPQQARRYLGSKSDMELLINKL